MLPPGRGTASVVSRAYPLLRGSLAFLQEVFGLDVIVNFVSAYLGLLPEWNLLHSEAKQRCSYTSCKQDSQYLASAWHVLSNLLCAPAAGDAPLSSGLVCFFPKACTLVLKKLAYCSDITATC